MARLIDADLMAAEETGAFISAQAQITDTATRLVNEVIHKKIQMLLADAPTVDIDRPDSSQLERMAVRCEECAYHEDEEPGMVYCPRILGGWVPNEFFCGDGKRRTDANEPDGT